MVARLLVLSSGLDAEGEGGGWGGKSKGRGSQILHGGLHNVSDNSLFHLLWRRFNILRRHLTLIPFITSVRVFHVDCFSHCVAAVS